MLRHSHAHLCSEHFAECDFVNFMLEYQTYGVCFKAEIVGLSTVFVVLFLEKNPVRISKDEADEQQAHNMIPKIKRYTDTLKQTLTRQRQNV